MKIRIKGMMCDHCTAHVKEALAAIPGLSGIDVSLADACATVQGSAPKETIIAAIDDCGYEVTAIEN